ncbi:hypothetical protein MAR_026653 [Mya arenaria]|uniref:Nuclease HARBI1 n=1 Tax=Mya arenaria TaxID=6604 RepID=A0ABY7EVB2_MYAAR|nr:hypothetical protein MAR_026653 [Mya arenaria]
MADRQLDRYYRYRRFRLPRRPRVFTDRNNPLEILDVESIFSGLNHDISWNRGANDRYSDDEEQPAPPPLLTVLCCLQFFATGAHHIVIAQAHGVSRSAVGKAIHAVSVILAGLLNRYVKFPTGLEIESVKRKFYSVAGQIDGLLLGDSGYPCRKYLMTPYANPRNLSEERNVKSVFDELYR